MYSKNGTYYTEDYSVSFGDLTSRTSGGIIYADFATKANTWTTWHLIPTSRPSIAPPSIVTKYVDIPGTDGPLDLTTYLTGKPQYGQRQGSLSFYVDNGHEHWSAIYESISSTLHGKKMKMRLMDDPTYYYEGRFTVGGWETGADHSAITISYQLNPYKILISQQGSTVLLWDPFNFDKDYDYGVVMLPLTASGSSKSYNIVSGDYHFAPKVTWKSGSITVSFGGVTKTLSSAGTQTLGRSSTGNNTLTISGNGTATMLWEGGML